MRETLNLSGLRGRNILILLAGAGLFVLAGYLIAVMGYRYAVPLLLIFASMCVLMIRPSWGIITFPILTLFTHYDPLGLGFSPEKLLMIALLLLWLARQFIAKPAKEPPFPRSVAIAYGLYLALSVVSMFRVSSLFSGLFALQSLAAKALLVFLVYSLISSIEELKKCIYSLGLLTFLTFGWMFISILFYGDVTLFRAGSSRLFAAQPFLMSTIFSNPNIVSFYGVSLFPLMFMAGTAETSKRKRFVFFALGVMAIVGTLLTFSRSGLVALLFATAYLVWRLRGRWLVLLPIGVILGGIVWLIRSTPFFLEFAGSALFLRDLSTRRRPGILRAAASSLVENPVIGSGPDTFKDQMAERYYMIERLEISEGGISAHNDLVNIAVETGILGLLAFLGFVFVYVRYLFELFKRVYDPYLRPIFLGLTGALVAAALDSQFHEVLVYNMFWYILALPLLIGKLDTMQQKQAALDAV